MTRVAVIGVGKMGKNHARVYHELEDVELVAIADSNAAFEDFKKYGCECYKDYKEMLRSERLDAVSIAVPTSLHSQITIDCLRAGLHVLVEKPIAATAKEADNMWTTAKEEGRILLVGHIERFNPGVQALRALIKEGKLGTPVSAMARRVGLFPSQIKDANIVVDLGIHDIDVLAYILGGPLEVLAATGGKALQSHRKDHFQACGRVGSTSCIVEGNWITPVVIRSLSVTGTKGLAVLNYITQELVFHQSSIDEEYDSFGDFIIKFGATNTTDLSMPRQEPLKNELRHFLRCVRGEEEPQITPEEAVQALTVAERISSLADASLRPGST